MAILASCTRADLSSPLRHEVYLDRCCELIRRKGGIWDIPLLAQTAAGHFITLLCGTKRGIKPLQPANEYYDLLVERSCYRRSGEQMVTGRNRIFP
jgi:hypothetical protein